MGPSSRSAWYVVAAIGLLVAALVFILGLFPRLNAADELIDALEPAYEIERVEGARAGVTMVDQITNTAEPITRENGAAVKEVPALVTFVSQQTGLPEPQVLAALEEAAPKTTSLLLSLPLSAVSEELPALVPFLSETLGIPEEEVLAAIDENFPGIAQVIPALLNTTAGFDQVPGIGGLTRFNGDPVTSVPDVRDYFAEDVVPVLETQREDFDDLAGIPGGVKL
ncbi:MAG: hypothetical protein M3O25_05715, partial [Actinomycetota bacterium]|nr:hypothetical protein [Actinomycetota bacterium]